MEDAGDITELRALPAVGVVLSRPTLAASIRTHGLPIVTRAVREVIERARASIRDVGVARVSDADVEARAIRLARGTLTPVLNATGVILHTNLGRAPLANEAIDAIRALGAGYSSLELDLDTGGRGQRDVHVRDLLCALTGAEDALVVNNNAAAVLLVLAASSVGREVVVSRGELVEVGGGFRIPDVLTQSGARLVEVGTTNRTHLDDYARAISASTALLLKVHRSNFAMVGFTAEVSVAELSALARERGIGVAYDAGSGSLTASEAAELPVSAAIAAGADVVTFSGDKMLGGPQAGILVGRARALEPMRRHPLMRALRPDKLCLAALSATLCLWRDDPSRIPVARFAAIERSVLEARASLLAGRLDEAEPVATIARVGGGAAPLHEIASAGLLLRTPDPDRLAAHLRDGDPPVIGRIEDGAVILDLRCVPPENDELLFQSILRARHSAGRAGDG
jgi:L-seryl-tRNA(Ser) seleniumtransferase